MTDTASKIEKRTPRDRYDCVIDALVSICRGDTHEAMRALLSANEHLENELVRMTDNVSSGFGRQRLRKASRRRGPAD